MHNKVENLFHEIYETVNLSHLPLLYAVIDTKITVFLLPKEKTTEKYLELFNT